MAVITTVGTAVGVTCGWVGGLTDTVLMRVSDVFLAFPGLVFALAVAGVLGADCKTPLSHWRRSRGRNTPGSPEARHWRKKKPSG